MPERRGVAGFWYRYPALAELLRASRGAARTGRGSWRSSRLTGWSRRMRSYVILNLQSLRGREKMLMMLSGGRSLPVDGPGAVPGTAAHQYQVDYAVKTLKKYECNPFKNTIVPEDQINFPLLWLLCACWPAAIRNNPNGYISGRHQRRMRLCRQGRHNGRYPRRCGQQCRGGGTKIAKLDLFIFSGGCVLETTVPLRWTITTHRHDDPADRQAPRISSRRGQILQAR